MKDNSTSPTINRVGSFTESKFGIASSEDLVYIFDILRNKLYSDKALAVVREYSTNAADANVENGVGSTPIIITVPNSMSPQFKVRDFGKGLSEDEVRNIYCMYGRSTKRSSNEFTGQLGLGSKSGFAYGDSFIITSFLDGKKIVYTAYIDESKLGAIAKISEEDTKEKNGVEITIPVKSADVAVFKSKIASVVAHFKVKPKINGTIDNFESKVLFSGDYWQVTTGNSIAYGYSGKSPKTALAVMGNIAYPIDSSQVFPEEAGNYWNTKEKGMKFICGNCILHFDIGDISIAASREDLEYNASTIKAIKHKAFNAWTDFNKTLTKELDLCNDGVKARACINRINRATSGSSWGDIASNLKWKDSKLLTAMVDLSVNLGMTVESFCSSDGVKVSRSANLRTLLVTDSLIDENLMYLADDSIGSVSKISDLARKNIGKCLYLFRVKEMVGKEGEVIVGDSWFSTQHFPKSYLKNISEHTIDKLKKESNSVARRPRSQMEYFEMINKDPKNWGVQSNNWASKTVNKSDIKYYIELNKFKPVMGNVERSCQSIMVLEKSVNKYGIVLPDYYCIKSGDVAKLDDDAVSLIDHIKDQLEENSEYNVRQSWHKRHTHIMNRIWNELPILAYAETGYFDPADYDIEKSFSKLSKIIVDIKKIPSKIESYNEIKSFLGTYERGGQKENLDASYIATFDEVIKSVVNEYPLIKHIASTSSSAKSIVKYISEYVKIIENK